jgi:hypothetical protein
LGWLGFCRTVPHTLDRRMHDSARATTYSALVKWVFCVVLRTLVRIIWVWASGLHFLWVVCT